MKNKILIFCFIQIILKNICYGAQKKLYVPPHLRKQTQDSFSWANEGPLDFMVSYDQIKRELQEKNQRTIKAYEAVRPLNNGIAEKNIKYFNRFCQFYPIARSVVWTKNTKNTETKGNISDFYMINHLRRILYIQYAHYKEFIDVPFGQCIWFYNFDFQENYDTTFKKIISLEQEEKIREHKQLLESIFSDGLKVRLYYCVVNCQYVYSESR